MIQVQKYGHFQTFPGCIVKHTSSFYNTGDCNECLGVYFSNAISPLSLTDYFNVLFNANERYEDTHKNRMHCRIRVRMAWLKGTGAVAPVALFPSPDWSTMD